MALPSNRNDPPTEASIAGHGLSLPGLLEPVNRLLDPVIRRGIGSPLPLTGGLVILEVTGRRSGLTRSTPLLCVDYGFALVVSTVRDRSQWVENLAACPQAFVWLRGQRRAVVARVFRRGELISPDTVPVTVLSAAARSFSLTTGTSVAVLTLA